MKITKRASQISPSLTLEITAKAKKMKADGINVVSFGAGEPDFNTPEYIRDAAKYALDKGMTKYTPASGTLALKNAICKKLLNDNGLTYTPQQIVVSSGAKHCLTNIMMAIVEPGDEVIIPSPFWLTYPELVKLCGGVPVLVQTDEANGFKITPSQLEKAITDKTCAVIFNNPNNPTGTLYTKDEICALAKVIEKTDMYVISDEIYENLNYTDEKCYSIAKYSDKLYNQTIIVNGVSKTYSMTGWRIGFTAGNNEISKAISNMQSHMTSNPNTIAQYATVVAYESEKGDEFKKEMINAFSNRRKLMMHLLDNIEELSYVRPDGAFYVFVNISKLVGKSCKGITIKSAFDIAKILIDNYEVAVIPCESFGADNFIRLSYAISEDDIEKGLLRIASMIKDLD